MANKNYTKEEMKELVAQLAKCSSATVHEALGRIGSVSHEVKPIAKGMKVCGPAFTVSCPTGDNLTLHKALYLAEEGDVLLANTGGFKQFGFWGEVMSVACQSKGIHALVMDGSVRDTREITELGFPIFSAGVCINGTVKATLGEVNVPITFGGIAVNPGDIVLGDDDGVVIVPVDRVEEAIEKSAAREAKERDIMNQLKEGKTLAEMLGLESMLGL